MWAGVLVYIFSALLASQGELRAVLSRAAEAERSGDLRAVAAAYRDAVALESESAALYFSLSSAEARVGRLTKALAAIDRACTLAPQEPRYALAKGGLLRELGNEEAAIAAFELAIASGPESKAPYLELADLYQSSRELDEAARVLGRYLERRPGETDVVYFLGTLRVYQNRFDEALAAFDEVLTAEPDHARAWSRKAHVEAQRPETMAEAVPSFRRSLELDDQQAYVWYELGALLGKLGELEDGARALERAVALEPELTEALYALGNIATRAGREDEARLYLDRFKAARDLEARASADEKRALSLFARGRELLESSQLDEAIDTFLQVTELNPRSHQAYAFLAKSYFSKGEAAVATGYVRRAMALSPGTAEYPYLLSLFLRARGDLPSAIGAITDATVLAAGDAHLANARGVLLGEAGELAAAAEALTRACALEPDNPAYLLNLADALSKLGRDEEADAVLTRYRRHMGLR